MMKEAKYQQIIDWICADINSGKLHPGDKLESENRISDRLKVSRQTVRHALGILEADGAIVRRQGSGNYISREAEELPPLHSSKMITIISTYLNGYIFPKIIPEIEKILSEHGYSLRIVFTHNKTYTERKILEKLVEEEDLGGIIIEPTRSWLPTPNEELYRKLIRRKVPMMFFHSYYARMPICHVSMDDDYAGRIATEYLIGKGHSKIAGIFKMDDGQGIRRYSGYTSALMDHGLEVHDKRVAWLNTEDLECFRLSRLRILERLKGCSACVCYNDEVAHELTQICMEEGIRIPEDLSLVSIDNSELAELNPVPLTSVVHPKEKLGQKVAEQFLLLMKDHKTDVTYEFKSDLCIRDSVTRCRG